WQHAEHRKSADEEGCRPGGAAQRLISVGRESRAAWGWRSRPVWPPRRAKGHCGYRIRWVSGWDVGSLLPGSVWLPCSASQALPRPRFDPTASAHMSHRPESKKGVAKAKATAMNVFLRWMEPFQMIGGGSWV